MWSNERDGFDDGLALDTCTYIMLTVIWRESANDASQTILGNRGLAMSEARK
jgi:hypothetical protein